MTRPTMSREFDQRIADWLENDPDDAPTAVLQTVLAAFPSIPQRRASRVPWRFRSMNLTTRTLAGAAAIAVVLVGGVFILRPGGNTGGGGTPPPSSPSPSSPAASSLAQTEITRDFTSVRYGYTVAYPSLWKITPATTSWVPGTSNTFGGGANDELIGPSIRFSGSAQPLAPSQTADTWLETYAALYGSLLGSNRDPAAWPAVRIDGLNGRIAFDGVGSGGGVTYDAVVVSGGIAYNFNMDGVVDRATFDRVLSTVRLAKVPVLDTGFTSPLGGYSIQRPSTWTARAATTSWTSGYETQSVSDHLQGPESTGGTSMAIDGTSMKLPAGMTFDAWFAGYDADRLLGTPCGAPSMNEDITVDGALGHLDVHCTTHYLEAVVPQGGRVYVFTMFTPFSRPLFEALLATVDLTPATASK